MMNVIRKTVGPPVAQVCRAGGGGQDEEVAGLGVDPTLQTTWQSS